MCFDFALIALLVLGLASLNPIIGTTDNTSGHTLSTAESVLTFAADFWAQISSCPTSSKFTAFYLLLRIFWLELFLWHRYLSWVTFGCFVNSELTDI